MKGVDMKILLIDNEQEIIDFYCRVAQSQGYKDVDSVSSAEEILTPVLQENYDLIVLDINMPGVDEQEICPTLRNISPHAIIAIISRYISEAVSSAVIQHADVWISKPIQTDTFIQLLDLAAKTCGALKEIQSLGKETRR